jgi:hypothetical protein
MESAPICHIDRIPNEILRLILSFVAGDVTEPENEITLTSPSGTESYFQCILVARWVSRRFRMIANELGFWHNDKFHIVDFLFLQDHRPCRQAQYISTLLGDDHLVACLNRKCSWTFSNLESFYEIVARIPDLPRNTRTVVLEWFPEGIGFVIYRLATFTAVTELRIQFDLFNDENSPMVELDLDALSESLPLLETLDLNNLQTYSGTLAESANLHTFRVELSFRGEAIFSPSLLPINSAQRLKSLAIRMNDRHIHPITHEHFDPFVNLADLRLPFVWSLGCDILTHGKFTLTSLSIYYVPDDDPLAENVLPIFSAQSVKFLRQLDFDTTRGLRPVHLAPEVADQLTSALLNLRSLEVLAWKVHCRTSWFKRWAPLRNLRSVTLARQFIKFDAEVDGILPDTEGYLLQITTKTNRFSRRRVTLVATRTR